VVLPQLEENKLMICFRTRSQLHIYLKELRALSTVLSAVSFSATRNVPIEGERPNLSYIDFLKSGKRLKDNCESSTKPSADST